MAAQFKKKIIKKLRGEGWRIQGGTVDGTSNFLEFKLLDDGTLIQFH